MRNAETERVWRTEAILRDSSDEANAWARHWAEKNVEKPKDLGVAQQWGEI